MQAISNFEAKLRLVFGVVFAVLLSTIAISVFVINQLNDNSDWVAHTHQVIAKINETHIHFGNARVATKNYLLTHKIRHLGPRFSSILSITEGVASLRSMTCDNPAQKKYIDELVFALQEYKSLTQKIIVEVDSSTSSVPNLEQFAKWTDLTEPAGQNVAACFSQMRQEEERLLIARNKIAASFVNQAYGIMPFMLAVQLILTAYIYYGVVNHVDSTG